MSQTVTFLRALRESGSAGVHSFELRRLLFIANPSQRYLELLEMGHRIDADPEKLHGTAIGVRYTLVHDAGGTGNRAKWLAGLDNASEPQGTAAAPVPSVQSEESDPIVGELGLRLFASPSDPTTDHYQQEAAA